MGKNPKTDSKYSLEEEERLIDLEVYNLYGRELKLVNLFDMASREQEEDFAYTVLKMMSMPEFFFFTAKYLYGIKLFPYQCLILKELWNRPFPMLIASRGAAKSFLLGIHALNRGIFLPGRKIVITGAGFRQAKAVFSYAEERYNQSQVLQTLVSANAKSGPHHDTDKWSLVLGDSVINALPVGDGSRIRGQRAHDTIGDEYASMDRDIFDSVVRGFGVVEMNPFDRNREIARQKVYKRIGKWKDGDEEKSVGVGNQTILSGTTYFCFNHFYDEWKKYKVYIESKGNFDYIFDKTGKVPSDGFNYRHYSIIRIPVEKIPEGYMSKQAIAAIKMSVNSITYNSEYSACLHPDTMVVTDIGAKKIIDIKLGDMVLTHKGRFRKVTRLTSRNYSGKVLEYKTKGYDKNIIVTPNHPYWNGDNNWITPDKIDNTYLANLNEFALSEKDEIEVKDFTDRYLIRDGYIYPQRAGTKITQEQLDDICNSGKPCSEMAREFNLNYGTVHRLMNVKSIHNSIPEKIKLNKDFGLVIGYYAAEGSQGANGRALEFALDGHVSKKLENFIEKLVVAIYNTFKIKAKVYKKNTSVASVCINQRIVVDLITKICPGLNYSKMVLPEILWSNKEFIAGFIEGYWDGDGHVSDRCSANTNSIALATQIKTALSLFGISLSLSELQERPMKIRGLDFLCAKSYVMSCYGENHKNLAKLIDTPITNKKSKINKKQLIYNDGEKTTLPFCNKDYFNYEGMVYNLEVEEDNSYSLFNATVHNCWIMDTDGFYKRSMLEVCTTNKPIEIDGKLIQFVAMIRGDFDKKYVMGVDVAAKVDNFAIVIVEMNEGHRRIVYCWTTNVKEYKKRLEMGLVKEGGDFYSFCGRKIRNLMKAFNIVLIACDAQGGGEALKGVLSNPHYVLEGEFPIYEVSEHHPLWDGKKKETDDKKGLHILQCIQFANADWTSEANHGMRLDFEQCRLLFPRPDMSLLAIEYETMSQELKAMNKDLTGERYDTLESCYQEITELKDELSTIEMRPTTAGQREKWDTPETKKDGAKKGRQRKDRYSALLMAETAARHLSQAKEQTGYIPHGGFVGSIKKSGTISENLGLYSGPEVLTSQLANQSKGYGVVVHNKRK